MVSVPSTVTAPRTSVATSRVAVFPAGMSALSPAAGICAGVQLALLFQLPLPENVMSAENNPNVQMSRRYEARTSWRMDSPVTLRNSRPSQMGMEKPTAIRNTTLVVLCRCKAYRIAARPSALSDSDATHLMIGENGSYGDMVKPIRPI